MFLQYHDVIKPVYLYAVLALLMSENPVNLPLDIIAHMSSESLAEWYRKRRYINPLRSIDFNRLYDPEMLDEFLYDYLNSDSSIYQLAPALNIGEMLNVYVKQKMSIPIYVYTEREEQNIPFDLSKTFPGIKMNYVYGDFDEVIEPCMENFTYILSDAMLVERLFKHAEDLCAHVLLCSEYRYNYTDNCHTPKIDIEGMATTSPLIHLGLTHSVELIKLARSIANMFGANSEEE